MKIETQSPFEFEPETEREQEREDDNPSYGSRAGAKRHRENLKSILSCDTKDSGEEPLEESKQEDVHKKGLELIRKTIDNLPPAKPGKLIKAAKVFNKKMAKDTVAEYRDREFLRSLTPEERDIYRKMSPEEKDEYRKNYKPDIRFE